MKQILGLAALTLLAAPAFAGPEASARTAAASFAESIRTPVAALVPALANFKASFSDEDKLIDLLGDPNAAVRAQAAKSLRHYAPTSHRAESKLLDAAGDSGEEGAVRREAIKSLAWAAQHYGTKGKLLDIAKDSRETDDIRSIAFKSLYVVAPREYDVRSALQSALTGAREPLAVRRGAAWALFSDAGDYSTRRDLLESARDSQADDGLRIEAVKSLFGQMQQYEIKNAVKDIARDSTQKEALREAAILAHVLINRDYDVRSFLEDTARSSSSVLLRTAAVKALDASLSLELVRYFHLSFYNGRFIDPLEDQ